MKKIALITGASKGIGKELAIVFAKNGYSLILVARSTHELEQLQNDLQKQYQCSVKTLSIDLSEANSVDTIITSLKDDLHEVEVLVNNAGFGIAKRFTDTSYEDINGILTVNMTALTQLTYKILPFMMAKKSGKILNVASTAAYAPGPYMAIYYASKAYVLSFSEALYEEYKDEGITVSALCPGFTKTSFQERAGMEKTRIMNGYIPMMTAKDVADITYNDLMKDKRLIIPGFMNKLSVFMMCLTPGFIKAKVTSALDKPLK